MFRVLENSPTKLNFKDSNNKKEKLLRMAWNRIKYYGLNKTTMDEIAKDSGVAKGTVYLYFRSKNDIMLAIVERTNARILANLEEISNSNIPTVQKLRKLLLERILAIFDVVRKYPHAEEVVSSIKPSIVKRIEELLERQAELVARVLREGVSSGIFHINNPLKVAKILVQTFEFLTPPYYKFKTRDEIESMAQGMLDIFLNGLCANKVQGLRFKVQSCKNSNIEH